MSKKIVASLFENSDRAEMTASQLETAGIAADHISVISDTAPRRQQSGSDSTGYAAPIIAGAPVYPAVPVGGLAAPQLGLPGSDEPTGTSSAQADRAAGTRVGEIAEWLRAEGVDDGDAEAYAEGVRRGGALLTVRCDESEVDRVVGIVDGDGPLDIDERQTSWRSEGWTGSTGAAATKGAHSTSGDAEQVIPIAEEELVVDKHRVSHGRVRIHTHVVEEPIDEQVKLRRERLEVERRPVDRPLAAAPGGDEAFQDRTVDVHETSEEAVVTKQARVTEEIVVRRDVDEEARTISDTVRRTEVEIEDDRRDPRVDTRNKAKEQ